MTLGLALNGIMENHSNVTPESYVGPVDIVIPVDSEYDISCPVDGPVEDAEKVHDEVKSKAELENVVFVPDTDELKQGYRILKELMADANKNVNWPFMDAIDIDATGLHDYYERVKKPMWLLKIKEKFESCDYNTMTEFVADFRLMLENCFRYNGPDHWVSKRAQRFETMLEQKLALLSRDLREKTTIEATSGKPSDTDMSGSLRRRGRYISPHNSSALLNQLRQEEALRGKEVRKQQILERKASQEAYALELLAWEDKLLEEPIKTQLRHMWEIPQIGLFLFLCQEPLNIGEVVQYELERCFAMARESVTLQCVMTTLLSTPYQRTRLDKKPIMPYTIWEEKLRLRLAQWYKMFKESENNADEAAIKLGIDPYFFTVLGPKNPLDKRKFHVLSFYKKIWIVKSLCDYCLFTQDSIRDAIDCQPVEENREYILGCDADGNTYMHFPQFCGADLRVYKQAPIPHPVMEPIIPQLAEEDMEAEIPAIKRKPKRTKSNTKHKKRKKGKDKRVITPTSTRPSRLRQHIKPVLPLCQADSSSSGTDSESDCLSSCMEDSSTCSSTYSVTRFRGRPCLNGRVSSKDNTPEPPSFRGKIRKPRDLESRLQSYSPLFKEWGASSKEGTPEPISSTDRSHSNMHSSIGRNTNVKSRRQPCKSKSKRNKHSKDVADSERMGADNSQELDSIPFQKYSDENSGNKCDIPEKEGCSTSEAGKDLDDNVSYNALEKLDNCTERTWSKDALENNTRSSKMAEINELEERQNGCESIANPNSEIAKLSCDTDTAKLKKCEEEGTKYSELANIKVEKLVSECIESLAVKTKADYNDKNLTAFDSCEQKDVKPEQVDGEKYDCTIPSLNNVSIVTEAPGEDCHTNSERLKNKDLDSETHKVIYSDIGNSFTVNTSEAEREGLKLCEKEMINTEFDIGKSRIGDSEFNRSRSGTTSDIKETVLVSAPDKQSYNENSYLLDHVGTIKTEKTSEEVESNTGNVNSESLGENTETETTKEMDSVLKEESDEELEEVLPEIGPFLLVADSVEGLRQLVEQFDETKPVVERSKRNKSSKPPPRKKCVVELHRRLLFLLKELEPWESKLFQATKRARLKLKKEKTEFVPQEEKKVVEDVWESEESETEEESSSSDENDNNQKPDTDNKSDIKIINVDQTQVNMAEDISTSSRGRLRKRKVIPNNGDDVKKRKVLKNPEINTSGHVPNILQRHQGVKAENNLIRNLPISIIEQLKAPTMNTDPKKTTLPATFSASQMLLMANITSKNNANSLLSSTWSIQSSDGSKVLPVEAFQKLVGKGVKASPTHPVIQQLLAQKIKLGGEMPSTYAVHIKPQQATSVSPGKQALCTSPVVLSSSSNANSQLPILESNTTSITNQLQLAGNKSRKIEIAKARPTAVQLTSPSPVKTTSVVQSAKVQHYNQNVLSTLPPEVIQQLLKNKSIRIQAVTPDKSSSGSLTGAIIVSPSSKPVLSAASTKPVITANIDTQQTPVVIRQVVQGASQSSTISMTPKQTGAVTVAPLPGSLFSHATVVQDGIKFLPPTSPNKPKYACHVTVKSLLQDRAKKSLVFKPEIDGKEYEDNVIVPSAAQVLSLASEVGQQLPAVLEMSSANSNSQPIVVTVNTAIKGLPQTLKLPSKETLDYAVQAVVTSVKTTLPTAHLKVPAPSTMPSIHPRKNVTRTIQSMKSPIPVVHVSASSCQSTPFSSSVPTSIQAAPTFALAQKTLTAVGSTKQPVSLSPLTSSTSTTGISYQGAACSTQPTINLSSIRTISKPVLGLNQRMNLVPSKTDNLLTLTPQTFMTSQGLVQGYLTPQGLVIPHTALQQGSPSKVIMANSNQGTQQVNVISKANGNTSTPNLSMPGKVIRQAMPLSDSTPRCGAIPTAVTVSPVSSSKLLIKAINTSVNINAAPYSENTYCTTNSEILASKSILSGINEKIHLDDKTVARHQGISGDMTKFVSPEIPNVNFKGDGIQEKKQHILTSEKLIDQVSLHGNQSLQRSPENRGLPAAQVLLSLSQGVLDQTSADSLINLNNTGGSGACSRQALPHVPKTIVTEVNPMTSTVTSVTLSASSNKSVSNPMFSPNIIAPLSHNGGSSTDQKMSAVNKINNSTENTQKLLLLNIGGKLYTSQGIPVTVDNGVLKIAETVSTSKQTNVPLSQVPTITPIRQPLVQGMSQQIIKPPAKLVQVPAASTGPVTMQRSVQPVLVKDHRIAKSPIVSPLKQIQVSGSQNVRQMSHSLPSNITQHVVGAIKQVLPQTPPIMKAPTQILTNSMASDGLMFSVPGVNQQTLQVVGLNNQQQPHLMNKNSVVHMVLPNTSHCGTSNKLHVSTPVIVGALNPQVNQQGIMLSPSVQQTFSPDQLRAAQMMSSRISPGQQLLSHSSTNVPANSQIVPINNVNGIQTVTGSQHPVLLQVVSSGISHQVPTQLSRVISPAQNTPGLQGATKSVLQPNGSVVSPVSSGNAVKHANNSGPIPE